MGLEVVRKPRFLLAAVAALAFVSTASAGSAAWQTWWGTTSVAGGVYSLSSQPPTSPDETHSALLTRSGTWGVQTFRYTATTLAQLRQGSPPNPWEVAWTMFHFRDLQDYYYFILKPNGFELGKKQGSDQQIFLVTGDLPAAAVGQTRRIQVQAQGPRIQVFVDGSKIVDYVDPQPLGNGSVGLYEEDSQALFNSLSIN
jgi:hypothetical protein